jgi:hypothetical protein
LAINKIIGSKFFSASAFLVVALLATACGKQSGSSSATTNGAPSLSYTTNPVNFTVGVAASPDALHVSNSVKSLSISPTLPTGLSFDTTSGTISGTPTTLTGAANYVITGTNSYGSNFVSLQLAVTDVPPTISYGGPTTVLYTVGTAITPISPSLGGGTTTSCVSSPSLPAGLSLSSQCLLSGTPAQPTATNTYSITAINSGGSAALNLTITVQDIPPTISYSPSTLSLYRGFAMSANVTNTGDTIISCTSSPSLPAGLFLNSNCQITGTPTSLSSTTAYSITGTNSGGNSSTTINIGVIDLIPMISFTPPTRTLVRNTASPAITAANSGGIINSCTVAPSLPTGLSVSPTTCQVTGTPTVISSSTVYTFSATNAAGTGTGQLTLTVEDITPAITYTGSPYVFPNLAAISPVTPNNTGGPITSCTVSPALPAALSLSSTCVITGTPSAASAATNYTVTASNSGGSSSQTISIAISQVAPIIHYSSSTYTFNKTVPITSQTVTDTGGPIVSCAVVPALPAGLSFSTSNCTISGTPTVAIASSSYTVTATNTAGSGSQTLTITVTDSPPAFTYPSSPYVLNLNQTISTITASTTGGVITSCSSSPTLPAGLTLSALCGISGTPTVLSSATTYTITGTNAGGSSTAPISIAVAAVAPVISYAGSPYNFPLNAAITSQTPANTGGVPTSCAASPTLPTGLSLAADCTLSGTPTVLSSSTSYTITGTNTGGSGSAAIVISVSSLPALTYSGSPFSFILGTSVGTITPSNSGAAVTSCSSSPILPSNLNLSNSCVISGTPTTIASVANYTITATNASGSSNVNISIVVTGPPVISYASSPFTLVKGTAMAPQTPLNSGSAATSCSSSPTLPAGLSLSASCVLSGTPTAVTAAASYTITGTNAAGSGTASVSITVNDVAPAISYAGSPYTFNTGTAITSQTPANTGGTITSCTISPALPTGLALSSVCVLSGTPTVNSAAISYTVTATNSGGSSGAAIVIAVSAVPALTYSGSPYNFTLSTAAGTITPTNAGGAATSCTVNPALPAGLTLASNCSFSGTPTAVAATTSYTITATNVSGSANFSISITVTGPPVLTYPSAPFFFTKGSAITAQAPTNTGSAPTSCNSSPALPAGLSLSSACVLSGTPTAVATLASYTITGTNAAGSSNVSIGIVVNDVAPNISYAGSPYTFAENSAITTQTPANTGGTITSCTVSPTLPTGLSLSSTCVITGTPTVLSSATNYTIVASNSGGNFPVVVVIGVDSAPVLTYSGSPFSFTLGTSVGTITPTNAGGPVNSCTVSPALPSGLNLANNCAISGTPTAIASVANYTITATNSSASANVNVSIVVLAAPVLSYSGTPFTFIKGTAIAAQIPANTGSPATSCSSSPTLPAGLSLSTACVLSGTPTAVSAATSYTITGTNSVGSGNATVNITINDVAPVIAYAGSPYNFSPSTAIASQTPSNTGGAIVSCAISPTLPTGLSLSSACVLSGTPTVLSAATSYTITATNTGGTGTASVNIAVTSAPALTYSGSPYSFTVGTSVGTITPTNTGATVTSCTISPALPSGLSLSGTCVLTGTPTAAATTGSYSITATNSSGTSSVNISITVTGIPTLTYAGTPYTFTNGTAITPQTPANTGSAATSCSASPTLPAGLSLSTACVLSGTPTAVSTATSYTITATNSAGSGTANINVAVIAVAPNISYAGSPYMFASGTAITAQTPANTGGTIVSCSASPTLPTGLSISSTCVISGTPTAITAATSYTITATNTGGTGTAAISIAVGSPPALTYSGSPYTFTVSTSVGTITPTNTGAAVTSCTISPALPPGLSMSGTCVITGTPTAAAATGLYTITPTNSSGSSSVNISITVNGKPILTYPSAPYIFTVGSALSPQTPTNTGSAATSCSSSPTLPAGLSLSTACVLSGTPTTPTTATSYTISGTNAVGTGTVAITITVIAAAPNISYAGSPYVFPPSSAITAQTPANTGGAIVSCVSSPTLPTGLALSSACVISGTPTTISAATSYTITATNTGGNSSTAISITISSAPALTYSGSPYSFTVNTSIGTVTPTNTGAAVTSCTVSPALPAGLSLSTTCALSGTPTAASPTTIYTINATNASGNSSVNISITVDGKPILTYPSAPFAFIVGTPITTQTPTNTGSAATSCSSSPTLPAGLAISTSCVISGTPTTPVASASYTISGTNAVGTGTVAITIAVTAAAPNISYAGSPYQFPTGAAITAQTPSNTGGTVVSCASSPTLPTGLAISATCVISGTPTVVTAPTSYTITATNTGGTSSAAIVIGIGSVPNLTYAGSPYSFTVATSAGTNTPTNTGSPVTSCSVSPSLPAGLSLSATCVLTGTPTIVTASASYSITATNSAGSSSVSIVIAVHSKPVLTYSGDPFAFTVGTAITNQTPTNTGDPATSCSSSPTLPAGLTISATCVITGTPTTPVASASYTISGVNATGTGTVAITIAVTAAAPNISYAGSPYQFPTGSAIASKTPSNTGGTIVSCASSPTLPTGLAISATCVISGTPTVVTAPTSYSITATNTGGTSTAAIVIGIGSVPNLTYAGSPYSFTVATSAGTNTPTNTGSPATSCSSSPSLPAGLTLSAACVLAGTPTIVTASASYTITATNSAGSSSVSIVIAVHSKPVLTYAGTPYIFTRGTAIADQTPTNTGEAATSCSSSPTLPAGLSISATCIITGTPTATSTATTYTISGTNATGTGTTTISITVNPAVPNISYAGSPYAFVKSAAITAQTPANTGGAITSCSSSPTLPTGLAISTACVISGTPSAITASASYTITATNAGGSGSVGIVIAVGAAPALTFAGSPYSYTKGTAITTVTPTNTGSAPTSCAVSPTLPGGLSLSSACVLSGTPTIASPSTVYTLTATNSFGTQNPTITITVLGAPIISYPGSPYTFQQGTTIGPVAPTNTGSPATSCSSSPTLPFGLSLSTTCTISGTPSGLTSGTYTITGTNAEGSGSTTVSITVTLTGMFRTLAVAASPSPLSIQPTDPMILFYSTMPDGSATSGSAHPWTVAQNLSNSSNATEASSGLTAFGVDYDYPPVYSPDETKIAFVSKVVLPNRSTPAAYNLWIMNVDGSNRIALTQNLAAGEDSFNPVFTSDSSTLYFQSKAPISGVPSESFNIWKANLNSEDVLPLTSQIGAGLDSTEPVVSPDGNTIAFTSTMGIAGVVSRSTNIWVMDETGGAMEPLTMNTQTGLNSKDPSFSPDGSMILFSSQQAQANGVMDIWEMLTSGSPQTQLTHGAGDSASPQMSLDGNFIAFVSKWNIDGTPTASSNIWEMNSDGTSPRYLTNNTASGEDSFFESGSVWVQSR